MIVVSTGDTEDGGIWIRTEGHSELTKDKEHIQVCTGCSVLLTTLAIVTNSIDYTGPDSQDLDGSGYMQANVPVSMLAHADFVIAGLWTIAENYPGHIRFERGDSRLLSSEVTREWLPQLQQFKTDPSELAP